tara:strand:+ start:218 stop:1000 length:783 start_codon:yes stop_codon:yes gene_type:complete
MENTLPIPSILTRDNGTSIAYHYTSGTSPGVMFFNGFKSDMTGIKALNLEDFCRARGTAFLRFDYQGHGQSSGEFDDGTIGEWTSDAIAALDQLTFGSQVLIGSSMGSWIMMLAALARPERVAGLIGLASAPDFTEDLILRKLSNSEKFELETNGFINILNKHGDEEPYRIGKKFLKESSDQLLLRTPVNLNCPIRLIHGINDVDVPWSTSIRIMETVTSSDIETTLVKASDHRLSGEDDIARLLRTLGLLLDQVEKSDL